MQHRRLQDRQPQANAVTIRSRIVLEMATSLVTGKNLGVRQAMVLLREQGVASRDWPVSLFGSATIEGVEAVVRREATMAIMNPAAALTLAYRGTGCFDTPQPIRTIAVIPSFDQFVFAVRQSHGIRTFEEIGTRRLPLKLALRGQADHSLHFMLDDIMAAAGFSIDDIRSWGGTISREGRVPPYPDGPKFKALERGEIDAIIDEASHAWLNEAVEAGMTILSLSEATVRKLEAIGYRRALLRKDEFPTLDADVLTIDFSGWPMFVHAEAPDALVTELCAALDDRSEMMPWEGEGPLPVARMCRESPDTPQDVPLHPAALAFWRKRALPLVSLKRAAFITAAGASVLLPLQRERADAQAASPEIEVAGIPNDTGALMFYAADLGLYEKAGLRVKVTSLNNSGSIAPAIASGTIQFGSFPVTVAALARDKGLPLVMIAPSGLYLSTSPIAGLLVAKNSEIRTAADLNGKTIATRDLSNMSYFAAKQWMDKNGGDSKTIRWLEIPDTNDVAAIAAGRIEAASVSEPALDDALRSGTVRSLAPVYDAIGKRFLIAGYYTSTDFAVSHADVVRKFAAAIGAAARWANDNRAQSALILQKYAGAPVLPGSTRVTYAERLQATDVQPILDVLQNYGLLKIPMQAKDLFSPVALGSP